MTEPDAGGSLPIWSPSSDRIERTVLTRFMRAVAADWNRPVEGYAELHRFSIEHPARFWETAWRFFDIIASARGDRVAVDLDRMPGAKFFPDARLNFAENLLRRRDQGPAIVFWAEDRVRRALSWAELYDAVSRFARALRAFGVAPGDRVAGYVANVPEALVAAIGAASVGAVWSSCSPDFGVPGALDRFGQIAPKVLVATDGYVYNGRVHQRRDHVSQLAAALPAVRRTVWIPYVEEASAAHPTGMMSWAELMSTFDAGPIEFEQLPFDHPLYIVYSSGTTGPPKCIVHGAGGSLVQHLKEHQLHCDIQPGDRVFYFTTCGWMMWNWLVSALASQATLLLFDGSPRHPDDRVLFDFADATRMTLFGTSARFIDAARKAGVSPIETHDLSSLRTMTSTGSPLAPESFDFVYEHVKRDIHLASVSGGTDILSCFVAGNPVGPVWRGEIQAPALGMRIDVFDDRGRSLRQGTGELVCTAPFPSMPLGFWNDPSGTRYRAAYYARFPGVWCHGDWVARTAHGGLVIYGRSDATLNPGGVRIGTAEIYRQVARIDEVLESVVIGQQWEGDVRVVLFVRLREGAGLDDALVERIRSQIRAGTTPRHVPAKIVQVDDIPRTKSGKIAELAVRDVVHGRAVGHGDALANPEALALYRNRPELG